MGELSSSNKRKVFISYDTKNFEKIKYISMHLQDRGFEVITNHEIMDTGSIVNDYIIDQINKCSYFILVVIEGQSSFCMHEYEIAIQQGKNVLVYINRELSRKDLEPLFRNRLVRLWQNTDELANCIIDDISRYGYSYPQRSYQFEVLVNEIFKLYGCSTQMAERDNKYDIIAEKQGVKLYIEAKAVRQEIIDARSIAAAIVYANAMEDEINSKFVLIVANRFSSQMQVILEKSENIIALDISNILYIVKDNIDLKAQLLSLLEYSVDDIEPVEPKELMNLLGTISSDSDDNIIAENLINEIQNWQAKKRKSSEYEDLCIRVLKNLFAADLSLWRDQQRSNEDLYRFDLVCKIKDNIQVAFWKFIEEYFRSKYIIFEFKNYVDQITQKEIYTTDKYLYAKALRCVAIIISCEGEDKNAKKAIKGTLRENGKLILSISNKDLVMMLKGKKQGVSPAEYLYGMLDTMLVELDK